MRPALLRAIGLTLGLAGCPNGQGPQCGSGNQCALNDFCLFGVCQSPSTVSNNLFAQVTPQSAPLPDQLDASLPLEPQQFYPSALTPNPQNGLITITLDGPQRLTGTVTLPQSCSPDAGYPIHLTYTGASIIPGLDVAFAFDSDGSGAVSGLLPVSPSAYTLRATTASACTIPVAAKHPVISAGVFDVSYEPKFPEASETVAIYGEVHAFGQGALPAEIAVRILEPAGAGGSLTPVSDDGVLRLDPDAGAYTFTLPVALGDLNQVPDGGCGAAACAIFEVEIGPSRSTPNVPTLDLPILAPLVDGGSNGAGQALAAIRLVGDAGLKLPIDLLHGFVPVYGVAAQPGGQPLVDGVLQLQSTDGGLLGCGPTCRFGARSQADSNGVFFFSAPPGSYQLSLLPPPPLGATTRSLSLPGIGQGGAGLPAGGVDAGQLLALAPQHVTSQVIQPGNNDPLLGGEALLLTEPGLLPVAGQRLDGGAFDLLAPPGNYVLLVQPDAETRLPTYYATLTVADQAVPYPPIDLPTPGQLAGNLQVSGPDGGLPLPVPFALIQFYFVSSDLNGVPIAIPVASTLTDAQGNWSAPGPPKT